ncbi:MAG: protein kinase [Phycisphaeraceae bacterium]|nr:protein kinase [Phycisphaeraceae bacterium]
MAAEAPGRRGPDVTAEDDPLDRLAALFEALREVPPADRDSAIDRACGGDAALAGELRALLAHHDADAGPLAAPLAITVSDAAAQRRRIEHVGPYRIIRPLGEGGMGVVHLAEQDSPRRLVALKMLRPGLVSRSLARRFAQESDLLGRLQHPGIAAVYEAGTADLGFGPQPYFAMEYVEGIPLTEHADRASLDRAARLRLVMEIAQALQHAHDRGIVHRDLKPANILIDPAGRPRILDFGVARSLDADARFTTLRTDVGQLVGTIPYMSPEQLDGRPTIDARSDVYALGVLTYELLTGRLPHEVRDRSVVDAIARLRHDDPTTLATANPDCRGDLDVIVRKALERDPDRRYPTATALARDLDRFLRDEPIEARPPSVIYRSRKFVRRHRTLVIATAALMLVLAGAAIVAALLAIEAESRRREAMDLAARRAREAVVGRIGAAAADLQSAGSRSTGIRLRALPSDADARWEVRHLTAMLDGSARQVPYAGESILRAVVTTEETIVTAERDGTIRIGRPEPPAPMGPYAWRTAGTVGGMPADLVADGETLAVAAAVDGTVIAFDPRTASPRWRTTLDMRIRTLAASEAAGIVAVVVEHQEMRMLEARDGRERTRFPHIPIPERMAFAPDGRTLLTWSPRGGLRLVDASSGALVRDLPGHRARVSALAFSPGGDRVATGDADGAVLVRSAATGDLLATMHIPGGPTFVHTLAFAPDARTLVAGTGIGTVVAWDLDEAARLPRVIYLPVARIQALAWHASASDRVSAITVPAGVFQIDATTLAPPPSLPMLTRIAGVLDGNVSAVAAGDGAVVFICMHTGEIIAAPRIARTMHRSITTAPDGRTVLLTDQEGIIHRWTPGESTVDRWPTGDRTVGWGSAFLRAGDGDGPSRWRMALVSAKGHVRLLDHDGAEVRTLSVDPRNVSALAADPSAARFVTAGADGRIRLWSADGADLGTIARLPDGASAVAWIDAGRLAAGSEDGTLYLIHLSTGEVTWSAAAHPTIINDIAVSPDRTRLATASTDRTVRLFDIETGDEVLVLRDITAAMHGIRFSADGATLAGTTLDGALRFWRTHPERTVAALRRLRRGILAGTVTAADLAAADPALVRTFEAQAALAGALRTKPPQ